MRYVCFDRTRHLVEALHHCHGDGRSPLPEEVYFLPPNTWAVPEDSLANFAQLSKQHGWQCSFQDSRNASKFRKQPLSNLISEELHYVDPLRAQHHGIANGSGVLYDPFNEHCEYVIGATDEQEAQTLLDLLRIYGSGIRAVPLP